LIENKAPDHHGSGLCFNRNQSIVCLSLYVESASKSNPPILIVTMHNGFEVRAYSYQYVFLVPLSWRFVGVMH
jgi:hypothetical protein